MHKADAKFDVLLSMGTYPTRADPKLRCPIVLSNRQAVTLSVFLPLPFDQFPVPRSVGRENDFSQSELGGCIQSKGPSKNV